jgi:hypothetical protein
VVGHRSDETARRNEPSLAHNDGWPTPLLALLDDRRGGLPVFPVDVLPLFWRTWAVDAARGASASVDHVALSLLTAAAGLIGGARRIAPSPSWSEPCILWTALVGPPSSGKTPAMETALRLVRGLEPAPGTAYAETDRQSNADLTAAQQRWHAPRRHLTVSDTRAEAIADVLQGSPCGVLLSCDNRRRWLNDLRTNAKGGGDPTFWLSIWSGTPCAVNRKDEPVIARACPAVSILGTFQSGAITPALAGAADGMTARFLFAWLERPPFHPLSEGTGSLAGEALAALARLRDMPQTARDVPLAADARVCFEEFRQRHHADATRLDEHDADWWGKGPGNVLRLAGVLTFLDGTAQPAGTAEPAQVPAWAVAAAAGLWLDYLWPHAQAVLRIGGGGSRQGPARTVLRWMRRQHCAEVSLTAIRREALSQTCDAAATARIVEALVADGWLRPIVAPRGVGRPPRRWAVNPHLHGAPDS